MLLTIGGGAAWGLSGSCGQYLFTVQGMDSRWLVPIRLFLAGVILMLYCLVRYGKNVFLPWKGRRNVFDLLLYSLIGVTLCQFMYFLTIQLSSAGIGTILQDLSPVMILAAACVMAKRKPRWYEIISIILALLGVFLITTHGKIGSLAVAPAALITGIISAVCVMVYNICPGRLLEQFPVTILQAWAFLMGGVVTMLVFRPWTYEYVPNGYGILGIAFVVVVGNIIAFCSYITGIRYIGPEKGILYGFSEPVTAAVVTVVFLGSPFTWIDAVGFAAVFLMMVMISYGKKWSKAKE